MTVLATPVASGPCVGLSLVSVHLCDHAGKGMFGLSKRWYTNRPNLCLSCGPTSYLSLPLELEAVFHPSILAELSPPSWL